MSGSDGMHRHSAVSNSVDSGSEGHTSAVVYSVEGSVGAASAVTNSVDGALGAVSKSLDAADGVRAVVYEERVGVDAGDLAVIYDVPRDAVKNVSSLSLGGGGCGVDAPVLVAEPEYVGV